MLTITQFNKKTIPISRILYLSMIDLYHLSILPTPFDMQSISANDTLRPKTGQNIRDIAAHKVYPLPILLLRTVSSYLTFSPFPS